MDKIVLGSNRKSTSTFILLLLEDSPSVEIWVGAWWLDRHQQRHCTHYGCTTGCNVVAGWTYVSTVQVLSRVSRAFSYKGENTKTLMNIFLFPHKTENILVPMKTQENGTGMAVWYGGDDNILRVRDGYVANWTCPNRSVEAPPLSISICTRKCDSAMMVTKLASVCHGQMMHSLFCCVPL